MIRSLRNAFMCLTTVFLILFLTPSRAAADLPVEPEPFVTFLDSIVAEAMREYHVPNAAIVVVRGDEIYALRGYGERDISTGEAVDPATTIFRVASVSKPVTATAVMTLADRGLIDLDDDVNQYLDEFQIAAVEGTAVTFHHLLTHSGGLDDKVYYATAVEDAAAYLSLQEAMTSSPPVRYAAAGLQTRYANQGYVLLGYLIEKISGMTFEAYLQKYVFEPLEMNATTFDQKLSPPLQTQVAKQYSFDEELGFTEETPFHVNEMPAGGLYTTAADMGNFMRMQLNQGTWDGSAVLAPDSVARMHAQQFSNHPALGGYSYGFWRATHNDQPLVMHDGSGPAVSARLLLLPDADTGIFIVHHGGDPRFRLMVSRQILDEFFGDPQTVEAGEGGTAEQFAGVYKDNRYVHDGYFRLPTHFGMEFNIRTDGDRLLLADGLFPEEKEYIQVSTGVFRGADDPDNYLVFTLDENNQVTQLNAILYKTPMDFEPAQWYQRNTVHLILLLVPTLIFLLATIGLTLSALYRWIRKQPQEHPQVRWSAWLLSLFGLIVMSSFTLGDLSPLPFLSPHLNPVPVYAFLTVANVAILLALGFLVMWGVGLQRRYWRFWRAVGYTVLAVGALLYLWFSYYNNLVGYQL